MYLIVVTYGTRPNMVYAEARSYDTAQALKRAAVQHGYTDAEIVNAAVFRQAQEAYRAGQGYSGGADSQARPLHDLRSSSRSALAR